MKNIFVYLLLSFLSSLTLAQEAGNPSVSPAINAAPGPVVSTAKKATEEPKSNALPITLNYGSRAWNKNSEAIDSAIMFIHDKNSDKVAKVLLEETEPDSSIFQGQFSLSWSNNQVEPEVFIPPQNMRNDPLAVTRFHSMLKDGKLKPQPLLIRKEKNKIIYDVFDNQEQLDHAQQVYEQEKAAETKADNTKLIKPLAADNTLQVAKASAQQTMMAKLAQNAVAKEETRIRQEQLEQQRLEQKKKEEANLAAAEKNKRKIQAESLAKQASAAYAAGDYVNAEKLFKEATEFDPQNKSYYFQYGVSLYRLEKLNEALITLDLAKLDGNQGLEKKYYIALIHYKLKEYPQAEATFTEVRKANNPTISPSAAYYEGLVCYSEEKYKEAQTAFEFVIDNSNDPVIDKKSEEYLGLIAAQIAAKKLAAKKWIIDATAGLSYDSNILLSPNLSQQAPSNAGGIRFTGSSDVERRLWYKDSSDMSLKLSALYVYSMDSKFVAGDPAELTFTAPYSIKGTVGSKGYKLTLTPGYDTVYLQYDPSVNARQDLENSETGDVDFMLIMNDHWFSSYTLDVRNDVVEIPSPPADQNMSAVKWTLKKTETTFLDEAKKRTLIGYIDYVDDVTVGSQEAYTKWDLGVIYTAPIEQYKNVAWNIALITYLMNYPNFNNNGVRKDTDVSLTLGASKIMNDRWTWSTSLAYTNNASNEALFAYDKYVIGTAATWNWDDGPKD